MKTISFTIGIAANLLSLYLLLSLLQVLPAGPMPLFLLAFLVFLLALVGLVLAILGNRHKGISFTLAIVLNALGLIWPLSLIVISMLVYFN